MLHVLIYLVPVQDEHWPFDFTASLENTGKLRRPVGAGLQ
jgi:hypothetical protein